jgi:hypothetical protein|eukprot:COSAG06_NODE_3533_length_5218_cov_616.271147_5_plen_65_part_00
MRNPAETADEGGAGPSQCITSTFIVAGGLRRYGPLRNDPLQNDPVQYCTQMQHVHIDFLPLENF